MQLLSIYPAHVFTWSNPFSKKKPTILLYLYLRFRHLRVQKKGFAFCHPKHTNRTHDGSMVNHAVLEVPYFHILLLKKTASNHIHPYSCILGLLDTLYLHTPLPKKAHTHTLMDSLVNLGAWWHMFYSVFWPSISDTPYPSMGKSLRLGSNRSGVFFLKLKVQILLLVILIVIIRIFRSQNMLTIHS